MATVDVDSIWGPLLISGDLGSVEAVEECPFTVEAGLEDDSPPPPSGAVREGSRFINKERSMIGIPKISYK